MASHRTVEVLSVKPLFLHASNACSVEFLVDKQFHEAALSEDGYSTCSCRDMDEDEIVDLLTQVLSWSDLCPGVVSCVQPLLERYL